jgi:hypothetical protein
MQRRSGRLTDLSPQLRSLRRQAEETPHGPSGAAGDPPATASAPTTAAGVS